MSHKVLDVLQDSKQCKEASDPTKQGQKVQQSRQAATLKLQSATAVASVASDRAQKRRKTGQNVEERLKVTSGDSQLPDMEAATAVQGPHREETSAKKRKKSKSRPDSEAQELQAPAAPMALERSNAGTVEIEGKQQIVMTNCQSNSTAKKSSENVAGNTGMTIIGLEQPTRKADGGDMETGSQPRSAAFDPDSEVYYTPEGIAERKRAKREKRALRRTGTQAPEDIVLKQSEPLSAGAQDELVAGSAGVEEQQIGNTKKSEPGAGPPTAAAQEDEDPGTSVSEKKEKKKRKKSSSGQREWISGPGNAAEAIAIRQKLGVPL